MRFSDRSSYPSWTLALLPLTLSLTWVNPAVAQLIPDNTLGSERSVVTPLDTLNDQIDGGALRGSNLFHSFQDFNIDDDRGAFFSNPAGIENILTRITGGNSSNIFGTLGVLGDANLFLLNPNGIVFGPNARLDLGGSFFASTAEGINFLDGYQFSATNPDVPPLLTINVPIGLQFGANPGGIVNQSVATNDAGEVRGLEVPLGETLALVGGNVTLDGGSIQARGGRAELGGLAGVGTVGVNADGSLSFPEGVERADVSLANDAEVNVRAGGGGEISVRAGNFEMSGISKLRAGIADGMGVPEAQAGDINIQARNLSVTDGALLGAGIEGQGNTGNVNVTATETVFVDGNGSVSGVAILVEPGGVGTGGDINIQTGSLFATNGALLTTVMLGQGNAGNVNVTATNIVVFDGTNNDEPIVGSGISSSVEPGGVGAGGNINIQASRLSVTNGAQLGASTFGLGNAGNINLTVTDAVFFEGDGSVAGSSVESGGVGTGGNINIQTSSLSVANGALLSVSTKGNGNAGNVNVTATDRVSFDGFPSSAASSILPGSVGNGGDLNIRTENLYLTNGAILLASTFGEGNSGNINLTATDTIFFDGERNGFYSSAFTSVEPTGVGIGGNINIRTGNLVMTNLTGLSASNRGMGTTGNLDIEANSIHLDGANFEADTTAGNEGNIAVRSSTLFLRNQSSITTDARGTSTGGNITLNSDVIAALENSDISANAQAAFGGRVTIATQGLFGTAFRERLTPQSDITATSALGPDFSGTVEITPPEVDPASGLVSLPETPVDAASLLGQDFCSRQRNSQFIFTGRGGIPATPADPASPTTVWQDWSLTEIAETPNTEEPESRRDISSSATRPLIEAQGWVVAPDGTIVLTAQAHRGTPAPPALSHPNCQNLNLNAQ
ncbi:MAG: S-layer family protein [Geitlerinemataceae cyanobacterium]